MLYVTGITGHSGKWFFERLKKEGFHGKIRCVMRSSREDSPEKYRKFESSGFEIEFAIGSLDDERFLMESLKGVTTVVHIAGIGFSPKLVDAAIANQVSWVILVHTTGRFSKYKSASEMYIKIEDEIIERCRESEPGKPTLNYTILRPTMIYGSSMDKNMYRLVEYLDKHKLFPLFGNGSNLMQPVHARDLGNAYYDVLIRPDITRNKCYDLSGKEPLSYLDVILTIKRYLGSKVKIVRIPISLSIFLAKVYNGIFKNAIITVEQVMRMQEDKAFSHKDASEDFGYQPLSFGEGIVEEVKEYQSGVRVSYEGVKY